VGPPDDGHGEAGALPELVEVHLRHRGAEASLQLRLGVAKVPPLALQRLAFGDVDLEAEDADESAGHEQKATCDSGGADLPQHRHGSAWWDKGAWPLCPIVTPSGR